MEQQDLKKAMEQVHIQDKMQEDIIRNLQKPKKRNSFKKAGTLAAALVLAALAIGIPTQAAIRYFVQQRMEDMPNEEVESLTEMLETQDIPADSFSRPYSEKEKERMEQLYRDYQNGTFPEGEIPRITSKEQMEENTFCYVEETGCFYFPDRELTDEELLEVIDFNYKRDYTLAQNPETKADIERKEQEQKQQQARLQEEGGISLQQAIEIAEQWMDTLYGVPIDGMEQNAYLDDSGEGRQRYCVNYSVRSQCYYYFFISAFDGRLVEVDSSLAAYLDKEGVEEAKGAEQIEANYKKAENILEELGIHDTYKDIYCFYIVEDGKIRRNNLAYYFIKDDESGYRVDFSCDGNDFRSFRETSLAEYEMKVSPEYVAERIEGAQPKTLHLLQSP